MTHEQQPIVTSDLQEPMLPFQNIFETGDFYFDPITRTFVSKNVDMRKTVPKKECELYTTLAEATNAVATFEDISQKIWGHQCDPAIKVLIRTHVAKVNSTLKEFSQEIRIVSVPQVGYFLNDASKPQPEPEYVFNNGKYYFDPKKQIFSGVNGIIQFATIENELFRKLAENITKPLRNMELDKRFGIERSIRTHICRINQKISGSSLHINNIPNYGYVLIDESIPNPDKE